MATTTNGRDGSRLLGGATIVMLTSSGPWCPTASETSMRRSVRVIDASGSFTAHRPMV